MPFTPTHALAILPLARARALTPSALAIGSMIPDLWAFMPGAPSYAMSHSWLWGPVYGIGYGFIAFVSFRVCRGPSIAFAPAHARQRLAAYARADLRMTARGWASVVISLVLGVWTHILWDSFTHAGAEGTALVPVLREQWLSVAGRTLPGYKVLQLGSSAVGLPILAWWIARWYTRLPSHDGPAVPPASAVLRVLAVLLLVCAPIAALRGIGWEGSFMAPGTLEAIARHVVTRAISLYLLGAAVLLAVAGIWRRRA